jgi:hypothetical protein
MNQHFVWNSQECRRLALPFADLEGCNLDARLRNQPAARFFAVPELIQLGQPNKRLPILQSMSLDSRSAKGPDVANSI